MPVSIYVRTHTKPIHTNKLGSFCRCASYLNSNILHYSSLRYTAYKQHYIGFWFELIVIHHKAPHCNNAFRSRQIYALIYAGQTNELVCITTIYDNTSRVCLLFYVYPRFSDISHLGMKTYLKFRFILKKNSKNWVQNFSNFLKINRNF